MTTSPLTQIKHGIAAFLALGALAIVLSPAYGVTVIDNLAAFTSDIAATTADFHAGTDALGATLAAAE